MLEMTEDYFRHTDVNGPRIANSILDILKGHHGPVWSIAFSPDGRLYATGSEDGTIKMWKNCEGFYGLWKGNAGSAADRLTE